MAAALDSDPVRRQRRGPPIRTAPCGSVDYADETPAHVHNQLGRADVTPGYDRVTSSPINPAVALVFAGTIPAYPAYEWRVLKRL